LKKYKIIKTTTAINKKAFQWSYRKFENNLVFFKIVFLKSLFFLTCIFFKMPSCFYHFSVVIYSRFLEFWCNIFININFLIDGYHAILHLFSYHTTILISEPKFRFWALRTHFQRIFFWSILNSRSIDITYHRFILIF
jgi:hypothetical protein